MPLPAGAVDLRVQVDGAAAQFYWRAQGTHTWRTLDGAQPADHLSDDYIEQRRGRCAFSGAMVGICAQDMDAHRSFADFQSFIYRKR